jgi:rhamnosyl/mannosyltransferase
VEWLFYSEVNRIIATSTAYLDSSSLLQQFKNRVSIVPLGIATEQWSQPSRAQQAVAEQLRREHGSPLWVTCSRLVPYKGVQHAILAMRSMPGKLRILGDGPERDALVALRDSAGLAGKVEFVGFQKDLVPELMAATALLLPSINRAEAFGIIQLEAMAAGCPVINSQIPGSGVPLVSVDGLTGLTVPVGDSAALAAAATRLAQDPALRSRLSANAIERVRRYFSLPVCIAQTNVIYEEVVRRSRHSHAHIHRILRKSADMKTSIKSEVA